jgi:hypothetical protein
VRQPPENLLGMLGLQPRIDGRKVEGHLALVLDLAGDEVRGRELLDLDWQLIRRRPELVRRGSVIALLAVVGPGVLAGLSDDDPAGITTYSILGASTAIACSGLSPSRRRP